MRNRLRKWSRGSFTAQCLRRSFAERTPPAEDEIVCRVLAEIVQLRKESEQDKGELWE